MHKKIHLLTFILAAIFSSINSYSQKNLYAGIEIGSKGIKMSVIDVNNIKKGDYTILGFWTENAGIAKGISRDGNLAQEDIFVAGNIVNEQLQKIRLKYNVSDENIFIVASSGVKMAQNTGDLVTKIKTLCNKDLEFIDAETEGKMLLKGSIPPRDYEDAMILDIGGGNTKGGFVNVQNDNKFEFFPLNLEYGTITLTEAINKTILIPSEANWMSVYQEKAFEYAPVLRDKIKQLLNSSPASLKKNKIYVSGGTVWAFTTLYYNQKSDEHFIPISLSDIMNYDAILKNSFNNYQNLAKENKQAEKVINTYDQRHLIAGNAILIACLESIPELKNRKVYFAKEGQIAWLVSYIVDRSKNIKTNF
ncbi:Ppx/GppA phosphatase family protein [Flavobacterium ajazii]|uniref:Ppx/GppA phosphatase family protein n=1 Tax=Flavobacterium ajazii TaxID=2692318 RepID=UPI0013D19A5D|nr:exopolyphosphatase [Flavobacterium ajazii]